ncbi:prepilin-type N-terminal cleavage/methylation domain-containing protein [Roseiconus lacunae]|uniref:pilus assembly FimT family protein n=1 Tax=Roseiconus lacunae TaxID=2605694 RepID=UPI00308CDA16|nr:prepilin-type N-terminal cleavage/methylation domain-containing protein [Stieleria sp. HD01]
MRDFSVLRQAFTLVEVLAVIAIISLLGSFAVLGVSYPLQRSQVKTFLAQLKSADAMSRARSKLGEPIRLTLDAGRGTASVIKQGSSVPVFATQLPRGVAIQRVVGLSQSKHSSWDVEYSFIGTSSTYALHVGPGDETGAWLLVLGLTGQSYIFNDRSAIDEVFRSQQATLEVER